MSTVNVHYLEGERLAIGIRDHLLTVDQPFSAGGEDVGPTPTELFVGSLAACVGHYAQSYLRRHHLPNAGLGVVADFELAEHPMRVGSIRLRIELPEGISPERRAGLLAVASHCTVHNTLEQGVPVLVELVDLPVPAER